MNAMLPKRLLLVEDDRALAELVSFHFDRAGYAVTRTGDGEEALILAEEMKPDLVLLDWMIEGISGIEVCRRLRRRQGTAIQSVMLETTFTVASVDPSSTTTTSKAGWRCSGNLPRRGESTSAGCTPV